MSFDKPVVIIDNGSRYIKAGFSCDNNPVSIFRSAVGRPKHLNGRIGKEYYDVFIGDEAVSRSDILDLDYPIENGKIINWDNMERIWHNVFYRELKVAPEDRSLLISLSPNTTTEEKYRCCQVMFDVLNVPAICIQPQSILTLYGVGITTGLSVNFGFNVVDINPIYEGRMINYASTQTGIAASQIMNYIKHNLSTKGFKFGLDTDQIIENIIKQKCYASPNAAIPIIKADYERKYILPSGEEIDVSEEAFAVAEILFQPELLMDTYEIKINTNNEFMLPIQEAIKTSFTKCDNELREGLREGIVACGGLAVLPGLGERLTKEMENILSEPVKVITSPEAHVLPWLGGAIFAEMDDVEKVWIKKSQYEEYGINYIKKKFL